MKICFLSIDVEKKEENSSFEGVEKMDRMLDVFKKHKANATLFVTGEVLEKYPDLVKKWAKDYEIGCHGYQHITLDKLNLSEREKQVREFIELYKGIFKNSPKGFRAPRNVIDNEQFLILKKYGFLYDASIFPRYPWWKKRYAGYKSKERIVSYWIDVPCHKDGASSKLLEIPESPAPFSIPLVGTWIRKSNVLIYKLLFLLKRPKFISFNMHSWDSVEKKYLEQLDKMLRYLEKVGYKFMSGEQIYESFSAQGGSASG